MTKEKRWSPGPEGERLLELRKWLREEVGACAMCSLRLAILGVENEQGRRTTMEKRCTSKSEIGCDDKARAMWSKKPSKKGARKP